MRYLSIPHFLTVKDYHFKGKSSSPAATPSLNSDNQLNSSNTSQANSSPHDEFPGFASPNDVKLSGRKLAFQESHFPISFSFFLICRRVIQMLNSDYFLCNFCMPESFLVTYYIMVLQLDDDHNLNLGLFVVL